jgi:hypothetical protein
MEYDLTKQDDVVNLMKSSDGYTAWQENCQKVVDANGGKYPPFWMAVMLHPDVKKAFPLSVFGYG